MTGFSIKLYTLKISLCPCTLTVCQIRLMWMVKSMIALLGNASGWLLAPVHALEGKVNKEWDQEAKIRTSKHELSFCLALLPLPLLSRFPCSHHSVFPLFRGTPLFCISSKYFLIGSGTYLSPSKLI